MCSCVQASQWLRDQALSWPAAYRKPERHNPTLPLQVRWLASLAWKEAQWHARHAPKEGVCVAPAEGGPGVDRASARPGRAAGPARTRPHEGTQGLPLCDNGAAGAASKCLGIFLACSICMVLQTVPKPSGLCSSIVLKPHNVYCWAQSRRVWSLTVF